MGVLHWLLTCALPLVALALQGGAAWLFVQTANATWGPSGTFGDVAAQRTTLGLFAVCGPLAAVLLGWGLYTIWSRLRLPAALATTLLYVPALLVSGLSTWVLGACLGWF